MQGGKLPHKRKAPVSEDPVSDSDSDDDFPELDGVLSQSSDDEDYEDEADSQDGVVELVGSDESDSLGDQLEGQDDKSDSESSLNESFAEGLSLRKASRAVADGYSVATHVAGEEAAAPFDLGNDKQQENKEDPAVRVTTAADGGVRYEYAEVDPVYDSDDSAREESNTIGNIPLSFYETYPHIGYSIDGKKIMRPAAGAALDALLDSIDVPTDWTGLTDPATGKPLKISRDERELLARIQLGEIPEDGYDPYPDTIEYFTSIEEKMPLSAAPEPKRRFVPSKHEAKRVAKLVRAIREGRILPYKPPEEREADEGEDQDEIFDMWANEEPEEAHIMKIPAPKLPLPEHDHSVNPPEEYLPSDKEQAEFDAKDEEDRDRAFLPHKYDAFRKVPGYEGFLKERFGRCMDLYLAPRVRKYRLNIDPSSLLPKLPRPEQLKPYPTHCQGRYAGHEARVRSVAFSPEGNFLASGGDDGTVCIWSVNSTHLDLLIKVKLSGEDAVNAVQWRPTKDTAILAAAAGEDIFIIVPETLEPASVPDGSVAVVDAGFGYAATKKQEGPVTNGVQKTAAGTWSRPGDRLEGLGVRLKITTNHPVKTLNWHRRGDYLCSVAPTGGSKAVLMHQLSRHATKAPFRKVKGIAQAAQFHPTKPHLFVATKLVVRCYDLQLGRQLRVLQPGVRQISSLDIHPRGDNVILGSHDPRLVWHDLDYSVRPYRSMRFHDKSVRCVKFHRGGHPLFADSSDDGTMQIYHGRVVSDLMENATIVPLNLLKGHKVVDQLGVLDLDWHPTHPWLASAGADGTCGLWI